MSSHSDEHHQNENDSNSANAETSLDQGAPSSSSSSSDDNGFIVVPTGQAVADVGESSFEIGNSVEAALLNSKNLSDKVLAEADSSSSAGQDRHHRDQEEEEEKDLIPQVPQEVSEPKKQQESEHATAKTAASSDCSLCPYYALGCNYLSQVQVPPKVRDLLLWSCPKLSGAVFGSTLVLLLSLSCFSLLTVVSSVLLLGLLGVGAYRFYLAAMFRIKGTEDKTFENLSQYNVSLPKDKIQELAKLLDSDLNRVLNQLKSILLWDSITTSVLAFVGLYTIYWIGSIFNTLTLIIIILIDLFTLPKVYHVYKVQIDQGIEKGTAVCHGLVQQLMKKLPFLNKKKIQ